MPTEWTTGTSVRYLFFFFSSWQVNFDPRYFILGVTKCYQGYLSDPDSDPTNFITLSKTMYDNPVDRKAGNAKLKYCYGLPRRWDYVPNFSWNFQTFVNENCKTTVTAEGVRRTSCLCPAYIQTDALFNYWQPWGTVSVEFVRARLFNAWTAIQFMITRVPLFSDTLNYAWATFCSFLSFLGWRPVPQDILLMFDATYVDGGRTASNNWGCLILNCGSLLWFALYIAWPGFIFYNFYYEPLLKLFYNAYLWLSTCCTPTLVAVLMGKKAFSRKWFLDEDGKLVIKQNDVEREKQYWETMEDNLDNNLERNSLSAFREQDRFRKEERKRAEKNKEMVTAIKSGQTVKKGVDILSSGFKPD
jgi:hypothetical protein